MKRLFNGKTRFALIVLNSKLQCEGDFSLFRQVWEKSFHRVCADGGANRLRDFRATSDFIPDAICGDFDSISDETSAHFESLEVRFYHQSDQDSTDLEKSIEYLKISLGNVSDLEIVVFGAFGDRFDHQMAHINCCFKNASNFKQIYLVSPETFAIVLPKGVHDIPISNLWESGTCGVIPIGSSCKSLTTRGLKWDLIDAETYFGGMISTSNQIIGEIIRIENSDPVLWCSHLKTDKQQRL